jgi:large conductance mechanosensitive channel
MYTTKGVMEMLKEFKEFIMRGNVLDLAVGVIIGGAFTAIVTALTTNLIFPGSTNVDDVTKNLSFNINGVEFNYGLVISAIITFLITAFVLFMIIKAVNNANKIVPKKEEEEEEVVEELETIEVILSDIRTLLAEQNNKKRL